ncbi:MAG TPA: lysophospholipid acyltransferase family protein [Candidatus Moranbacteria bacterium]|nr:lysophospholipid acyltransferase family protein [Candidatus Moranbacteria bacterium]
MWKRWLDRVDGLENIPWGEPAIIASNHLSYFDFFVLASFLEKQTVFIATKGLDQRQFVGWFMKLDTIIYVDRDKPGYSFFKEIIRQAKNKKLIVIYPEGMRSRSGKMLPPKTGFIKLALLCGIPVIPLAMKGTYEILPPHRHLPKFTRCSIEIGSKIYLSPSNPILKDIFYRCAQSKKFSDLTDEGIEEIAFRIMNQVRVMAGQEWDDTAVLKAKQYGLLPHSTVAVLSQTL